jgi:type II secretory pathway predicted ATPase ExeA
LYEEYWKLKEKPFENVPNTHFFYHSRRHDEALMRILYAIEEKKGAAMLTGEYGSGKTFIVKEIINRLEEQGGYRIALIVNPVIPQAEFLSEIIYQLGRSLPKEAKKTELLHSLSSMLHENIEGDRHAVVIIDEAQAIGDEEVFEELRLLLNLQVDKNFLLTLLLVGQPELGEKISKLRQFKQRLSIRYNLTSLNQEETRDYIHYRTRMAGAERELFTDAACGLIYTGSRGIPREINNICDISLLVGAGRKVDQVDEEIVKEMVEELRRT